MATIKTKPAWVYQRISLPSAGEHLVSVNGAYLVFEYVTTNTWQIKFRNVRGADWTCSYLVTGSYENSTGDRGALSGRFDSVRHAQHTGVIYHNLNLNDSGCWTVYEYPYSGFTSAPDRAWEFAVVMTGAAVCRLSYRRIL